MVSGAIYLIASYDFCKHTIMLCNKPLFSNFHELWPPSKFN